MLNSFVDLLDALIFQQTKSKKERETKQCGQIFEEVKDLVMRLGNIGAMQTLEILHWLLMVVANISR